MSIHNISGFSFYHRKTYSYFALPQYIVYEFKVMKIKDIIPIINVSIPSNPQVRNNLPPTSIQAENTTNSSTVPFNPSNFCFICKMNFCSTEIFISHIRCHFVNEKAGGGVSIGVSSMDVASEELWT